MQDSTLFVGVASLVTYGLYHTYEPRHPAAHLALLFAAPGLLARHLSASSSCSAVTYILTYAQYWSLLTLFVVAYRVSPFHPLAAYPGPIPAKISKFWASYLAARGDQHEVLRKLHLEHGPVIRTGPNELSFADADAVQPVLVAKLLPKGPYYETRAMGDLTALDGLRDFNVHSIKRKPWIRAMSSSAMEGYEDQLEVTVRQLIDSLETRVRAGEPVDISTWMSYFGFDFMGKMAFGHEFGMLRTGTDVDNFWHTLETGVAMAGIISHIPWTLPVLNLIPGGGKEIKGLQAMCGGFARTRVAQGSSSKDIFYYLTGEDDLDRKDRPVLEAVTGDAMLAVIAGSDTTATALSHLWYFLLKNPQYYERLRAEVLSEAEGDFKAQVELPFLNACINESLRLYPPVISGVQRRVDKGTGEKIICNHVVPEGTSVSVHVYSLHRSSTHFSPIPDVYWPDRWLASEQSYTLPSGEVIPAASVKTDKTVFLPFSAGPQNCAGRGLAVVEMRAVAAAMVRKFESMQAVPGQGVEDWEKNVKDIYIQLRGPLVVNMKLSEKA
ncbi:cytochrome P450 [Trametopsis cervina]|nr:cytochrome P450 [Trametopsis cervina]